MWIIVALASLALVFLILMDGFEAMVLPRRVTRRLRYTRLYYRLAWSAWRALACRIAAGPWREAALARFGPLSLLGLFASWVACLIFAFGLLHWSLGTGRAIVPEEPVTFASYLYLSGQAFFTLGMGDVTMATTAGRFWTVVEAGMGFAFLALIIGYLPVLYQAFSRREVAISLLDARAGSPPSAAEALVRLARSGNVAAAESFLAEWERWSGELLESHLSFPVLSFYRSQHDNQSWLSALTAVLDTCAFLIVGTKGCNPYQAQLTFAMARHAAVDLALVFKVRPVYPEPDRLPAAQLEPLAERLRQAGLQLRDDEPIADRLAELRRMYEPFVAALAGYLMLTLPEFVPAEPKADNWQRSAWMRPAPGIGELPVAESGDGHFS
jgi:hypothetical protein